MADDVIIGLNKFFSLVLIFTITAINLWLIGNFLYWKNVFSKDKKCIIASIAISDLLIGVFCLPVEASLYFAIYLGGPGCVMSYVQVYSCFFSPFVYGIGITILCVELILKSKGMSFYNCSKFLTVFVSAMPWLLAVIIVIPLIFIGSDSESCWYLPLDTRGICIWAITTFVPIFLFLVTWIITAFMKWKSGSESNALGASYSVWRDSTTNDFQHSGSPANQSLIMDAEGRRGGSILSPTNPGNNETSPMAIDNSSNSQPMVLNNSGEMAAGNLSRHQFAQENQQLITFSSSSSPQQQDNVIVQPTAPASSSEYKQFKKRWEALYILFVILVYVIVTVPFALYNLMKISSFLYGSDYFTSERTFVVFKWMHCARSLLVPLTWSIIFYVEKYSGTGF